MTRARGRRQASGDGRRPAGADGALPARPGRPRRAAFGSIPALLLVALGVGAASLGAQVTENPLTVSPGHYLLRVDALSLQLKDSQPEPDGTRVSGQVVGATFLTAGLAPRFDLQIGLEPFVRDRLRAGAEDHTDSGVGAVYLRPKWTFWSDAEWETLAAVMPYVKLPTHSGGVGRKAPEAGVIVPWSMALDHGYRAGAMTEWDLVRNDADDGYDSRWFNSLVLQGDLSRTSGLYLEGTLAFDSAGFARTEAALGIGWTVETADGVELDFAFYGGLTRATPRLNPEIRLRWHF